MAVKFFTTKKFFQDYLPIALTLFMLVTIERVVITDGGNDRLYGFPLPYITSSYAFSFHYDVFILPMLFNLFTFFCVTIGMYKLFEKLKLTFRQHWIFLVISILLSIYWVTDFALTVRESSFYAIDKSEYKTTSRTLIFGRRP